MSGWNSNDAKDFLDVIKTVANKTFDSKNNILKTALAVVIDASDSINPTIRLLNSPDDGSQDFDVLNMSGEVLVNGDSVWLNYWDGYTNAYIAVKNGTFTARGHASSHKTGGADALLATDIDAMPESSVSSNLLINGGFDIWQRGTSQTASGYGSDDRWNNYISGGTSQSHSQQSFSVGQTDVPNNPTYYSRTIVTSGNGASDRASKHQMIENVAKYSGSVITVSFWAKANTTKNISVEFVQCFGTGGSTSVTGIGVTKIAITSSWALYTTTVTLPSVSGKTIGANSALQCTIWFDAGSSFNARTGSLGNQSGTFDIANVQLNYGSVALPFVPRPLGVEKYLCLRYFYKTPSGFAMFSINDANASFSRIYVTYPVPMRITPTTAFNCSITPTKVYETNITCSLAGAANESWFINGYTADAEL